MLRNRIGIITFHFAYNYGAVLQSLALYNFLSGHSYNVKIINYFPPELHHEYSLNPLDVKSKREILRKCRLILKRKKQYALFDCFIKNNIDLTQSVTKEQLKLLNKDFDCFITGSDQVWNDDYLNDSSPYFLSFADSKAIKISYAASFGNENISNEIVRNIEQFLPSFTWVSVRERFGVSILDSHHIHSDIVIDPVFLLSVEEWEKYANPNIKDENIILYYLLRPDKALEQQAIRISSDIKSKIIGIHPTCQNMTTSKMIKIRCDVGPGEFLSLINNAKVIVTNSFHAFAFGLIYNKPVIFNGNNKLKRRICDLLNEIGYNYNEDEIIYVDPGKVNYRKLHNYVESSKELLLRIFRKK